MSSREKMDCSTFLLPANPQDKYYLKNCFVCQEKAAAGKDHSRHYLGLVCLSCKAFFSRCHQTTKSPNFFCSFDAKCVITPTTRRNCQQCRYQKCIQAGMSPDAVLTDQEKRIRFRKFNHRKNKTELMVNLFHF